MVRPKRLSLLAIPVTVLVVAAALAFIAAQRTLTRSARDLRTQSRLAFTLNPIDLTAARAQSAAFEPVASPSSFTSGVFLDQRLYLAGPGGLSVYSADGTLIQRLRTGAELPVQPIVAIATTHLRGVPEPQLLLATDGAGLLILTPTSSGPPVLHELLPATPNLRDLTALLPLPSGDLLLGTRNSGLLLYDGTTLAPAPGQRSHDVNQITALAAADNSSFLIGTRSAGLFYFHGGTVETATNLPDNQIESLLIVGQKAYAGTPLGIAEFDLTADTFRPARILAPGMFAHTLSYDAATNQLLAGTLDQGIRPVLLDAKPYLHNISITTPRDIPVAAPAQRIDAFLTPAFALAYGTLIHQSGNAWNSALPSTPNALTDRNISALAFAPDGSLYIGFFDRGLDILSADNKIRHLEDDHVFCINRLAIDPARQTIVAATANGLVLFDRQGIPRQTLTRRDGLISDHVTDLAFTRTGLTVATPAGLTFITATGNESLYAFQGLVNNHVYAVASRAGTDQLLAGTLGGLSLLEQNSVRRSFTATNSGLKHNWITALLSMPDGNYLIGTYGAGLEQFTPNGSITSIDLPAGTPRNLIINPNALLATPGHIYAGTLDHGLLAWSAATGRWSAITRGLPSLNVTAFAARNGELYIGTENGLVRIAESKLETQLQ